MEQQTQGIAPASENGLRTAQQPLTAKELFKLDFSIEELKSGLEGRISSGTCSVVISSCAQCGGCRSCMTSCASPGD